MAQELDAGLSEIVRFLAQRPPFDALAVEELAEVAAQAAIEFHLRGTVILSEDGGPVTFLRVIRSGGVDIAHEGRLLDLLGPGDTFGHAAMLSGLPPGFEARGRGGHPLLPDPGGRRPAAAGPGAPARAARRRRPRGIAAGGQADPLGDGDRQAVGEHRDGGRADDAGGGHGRRGDAR